MPEEKGHHSEQTAGRTFDEIKEALCLGEHREEYSAKLLNNIKQHLPELEKLLAEVEGHWCLEDGLYRFYHASFKVFGLQGVTEAISAAFRNLLPDRPLNQCFLQIVAEGTGKQFEQEGNENFLRVGRAIVEAAFHAHYFLKLACKYGRELDESPQAMPSGWAAVLYLFNLR